MQMILSRRMIVTMYRFYLFNLHLLSPVFLNSLKIFFRGRYLKGTFPSLHISGYNLTKTSYHNFQKSFDLPGDCFSICQDKRDLDIKRSLTHQYWHDISTNLFKVMIRAYSVHNGIVLDQFPCRYYIDLCDSVLAGDGSVVPVNGILV